MALMIRGQPPPSAGRVRVGGAKRGQVGASKEQVKSQTCREMQKLSPEGPYLWMSLPVHFSQGLQWTRGLR